MQSVRLWLVVCLGACSVALGCESGSEEQTDELGGSGAGGEESDGSGGQAPSGTGGESGASLCEEGCVLTVAAACENGPASEAACVADCEELRAGSCGAEYGAFQTCADGEPVECGDSGIPVALACSDEQATFIDCLNAP